MVLNCMRSSAALLPGPRTTPRSARTMRTAGARGVTCAVTCKPLPACPSSPLRFRMRSCIRPDGSRCSGASLKTMGARSSPTSLRAQMAISCRTARPSRLMEQIATLRSSLNATSMRQATGPTDSVSAQATPTAGAPGPCTHPCRPPRAAPRPPGRLSHRPLPRGTTAQPSCGRRVGAASRQVRQTGTKSSGRSWARQQRLWRRLLRPPP